VIIPAEGILSQMLSDNGVTSIEGVSVMDYVAVTLAHAEYAASTPLSSSRLG
jgi:hypothetical protein